MEFKHHVSFPLADRSFLNIVKRDITKLAESYGFNTTEVGKINIIIAEMASNLIKHGAIGGELLVKPFGENNAGLEMICLDKGPGMHDPQKMLEDGVSTAGTSGEGLGAIKRISDEFDIHSKKEAGTIIVSRLYKTKQKPKEGKPRRFDLATIMVPKSGETHCGDAWAMQEAGLFCWILVADGLGHGEFAEEASQSAVDVFLKTKNQSPTETIRHLHSTIKRSRGAVANVGVLDLRNFSFSYCGVGNIAGRVIGTSELKSIISYNGILGHNIPTTMHDHTLNWNNSNLLVLHSDGIKSKWDLNKYKDLSRHDPSIIAAIIYRDFNRGTDDSLVLVGRTRN